MENNMIPLKNIYVPWEGWKAVKLLGKGGFGKVYEIERSMYGHTERSAMKCISIPQSRNEIESDYDDGYDEESIRKKYDGLLQNILKE